MNRATKRRWEEMSAALKEQTEIDYKRYRTARGSEYSRSASTPRVDAATQKASDERAASLALTRDRMAAHPNKENLRLPPSDLTQSPPLHSTASSSPTPQSAVSCSPTPREAAQKKAPQAKQGRHPESCQCKGRAAKDSDCQNIARGFREHGDLCLCRGRLQNAWGKTTCMGHQKAREQLEAKNVADPTHI